MEIVEGPYFMYSRNCLKPFGLWPFQTTNSKIISRTVTGLAVLTILIPYILKAYELRKHFHYFLLCIPSLLYFAHYLTKFMYIAFRENEFRELLERVKSDFSYYKGESRDVLHEYLRAAQKINAFYSVYLCQTVFIFNVTAFIPQILDFMMPLNESRPRHDARLVKYNIERIDNNNFYFVLIHGSIIDVLAIAIIVGFDALFISFVHHASALFKIVVFLYDMEAVYTLINFLMFGISLATITVTEFETILHKDVSDVMLRFAFFTTGQLLNVLCQTWPGQKIKDHSARVHEASYQCEWYKDNIPNRSKKLLILMMIRSETPSYLTAGKIFVLDLQTFVKICKASVSYFAFLSSVNN